MARRFVPVHEAVIMSSTSSAFSPGWNSTMSVPVVALRYYTLAITPRS